MRVSVRLSNETMQSIEKLKIYFKDNPLFDGLRITNGNVVNHCFQQLNNNINWADVIRTKPIIFDDKTDINKETKTNLTLNKETIEKIEQLKIELPSYTGTSYVTTPYIIRMVVRAYILNNHIE